MPCANAFLVSIYFICPIYFSMRCPFSFLNIRSNRSSSSSKFSKRTSHSLKNLNKPERFGKVKNVPSFGGSRLFFSTKSVRSINEDETIIQEIDSLNAKHVTASFRNFEHKRICDNSGISISEYRDSIFLHLSKKDDIQIITLFSYLLMIEIGLNSIVISNKYFLESELPDPSLSLQLLQCACCWVSLCHWPPWCGAWVAGGGRIAWRSDQGSYYSRLKRDGLGLFSIQKIFSLFNSLMNTISFMFRYILLKFKCHGTQ